MTGMEDVGEEACTCNNCILRYASICFSDVLAIVSYILDHGTTSKQVQELKSAWLTFQLAYLFIVCKCRCFGVCSPISISCNADSYTFVEYLPHRREERAGRTSKVRKYLRSMLGMSGVYRVLLS